MEYPINTFNRVDPREEGYGSKHYYVIQILNARIDALNRRIREIDKDPIERLTGSKENTQTQIRQFKAAIKALLDT